MIRYLTGLVGACLLLCASPAAAEQLWAPIAETDLEAVHRLISDNHPGAVDEQNPAFAEWLEQGLAESRARAAEARTFSDYKRVLRYYLNGFSDGHLAVSFAVDTRREAWPGFLPILAEDGDVEVGLTRRNDVPQGSELLSCNGVPIETLLAERVDPYWVNREIPHLRSRFVPRLMMIDQMDRNLRLQSCTIETAQGPSDIELDWTLISSSEAEELRDEALASIRPQLGLREIDGIWFASMPSFFLRSDEEVAAFRAFLSELQERRDELANGVLILDVRGNGGGNSAWGSEVATAIWGEDRVERVENGFDDTVDWRVSPAVIARNRDVAAQLAGDGLDELSQEYRDLAEAMQMALEDGQTLYRVEAHPEIASSDMRPNPFTGRVYLLTDNVCFSACLGFADLVRSMPGVVHIGLPTAADTIYMENTFADLPSGLAQLFYSQKVYRNRVRGHNEWYEPHIRWPGGPMTDEAVADWVRGLDR